MKQNYEMLEVSVVLFDNEDIVTTSGSIVDNVNDAVMGDNDVPFPGLSSN